MRTRVSDYSILALFLVAGCSLSWCQTQSPKSNPQAVHLAAQSIAALTGETRVNDVTLTGSVTWSGGSAPETGTVTLLALGTGESRMNLSLSDGTRSEIRDASTGVAEGEWIAQNGSSGRFAPQNCATDAVWFFPALGSLTLGPNIVLAYIGKEDRDGVAVEHIQSYTYRSSSFGTNPTAQRWSAMDFYLDATTLLPVAITFSAHPDNNMSSSLPVEVVFLNYQTFNGVKIPTHIQRALQGNVLVDIDISGASLNTGLPLSDFQIN